MDYFFAGLDDVLLWRESWYINRAYLLLRPGVGRVHGEFSGLTLHRELAELLGESQRRMSLALLIDKLLWRSARASLRSTLLETISKG